MDKEKVVKRQNYESPTLEIEHFIINGDILAVSGYQDAFNWDGFQTVPDDF